MNTLLESKKAEPLCKLGICAGTGRQYIEDQVFDQCPCGIPYQPIADENPFDEDFPAKLSPEFMNWASSSFTPEQDGSN